MLDVFHIMFLKLGHQLASAKVCVQTTLVPLTTLDILC